MTDKKMMSADTEESTPDWMRRMYEKGDAESLWRAARGIASQIEEQAEQIERLQKAVDVSIEMAQDAISIGYKEDGKRWLKRIAQATGEEGE